MSEVDSMKLTGPPTCIQSFQFNKNVFISFYKIQIMFIFVATDQQSISCNCYFSVNKIICLQNTDNCKFYKNLSKSLKLQIAFLHKSCIFNTSHNFQLNIQLVIIYNDVLVLIVTKWFRQLLICRIFLCICVHHFAADTLETPHWGTNKVLFYVKDTHTIQY